MCPEIKKSSLIRVEIDGISILDKRILVNKDLLPFIWFGYNFEKFIVIIIILKLFQLQIIHIVEYITPVARQIRDPAECLVEPVEVFCE